MAPFGTWGLTVFLFGLIWTGTGTSKMTKVRHAAGFPRRSLIEDLIPLLGGKVWQISGGRSRARALVAPGPDLKGLWSHRDCQQPGSTVDHQSTANPTRIRPGCWVQALEWRSDLSKRKDARGEIPSLHPMQNSRCLDGCCRNVSMKVAGHIPSVFSMTG